MIMLLSLEAIGCNTWNANANENGAWLANPHRKGEDDMGRVYGVKGAIGVTLKVKSLTSFVRSMMTYAKVLMTVVKF